MLAPFRVAIVVVALLFLLGCFEVELSLRVIRFASIDSRDPAPLREAVRIALAVGAALCLLAAALAQPGAKACVRAVERLAAMDARRFWWGLALLGVAMRLLVAAAIDYQPVTDAWWLQEAALSLLHGDGFAVDGTATATRPPGYPAALAVFMAAFGTGRAAVLAIGLVSGAGVVAFGYGIAKTLYGERAARISALLLTFYPALVLMSIQSLSDLFFLALLLSIVYFVLRTKPSLRAALALGAMLGIAQLTRGMAIGLFVVMPLLWFARHRDWPSLARNVAVTGLIAALFATPWALRNERLFGHLTLETHVGMNLYWGNHAGAISGAVPRKHPDFAGAASMNEAEKDAALFRHARAYILDNPVEVLKLMPGKLFGLYAMETEVVTSLLQAPRYRGSTLKYAFYAISQLAYLAILFALAARGWQALNAGERPVGSQWAGPILCAYFTLLCLVFHGEDRYRLPILPWMIFPVAVLLAGPRRDAVAENQSAAVTANIASVSSR